MIGWKGRAKGFRHIVKIPRRAFLDVMVSGIPQVISLFTGFMTTYLIARGIGPAGLGDYSLMMTVPMLISQLSDMGIGQTSIRFASRAASLQDESLLHSILRWGFTTRLLATLVLAIAGFFLSPILSTKLWHSSMSFANLLRLALLISVFATFASAPIAYFQSLRRFATNSVIVVLQKLISLVGLIFLALCHCWSLLSVVVVSVVTSAVGALAFLAKVPKAAFWDHQQRNLWSPLSGKGLSPTSDMAEPAKNFVQSGNIREFAGLMTLSSVIVTLIMQADLWLMGLFLPKGDIGVYSAAVRFTLPLTILLSSIQTVLWPRVSAITSNLQARALLRRVFVFGLGLCCFGFVYSLTAPSLVPIIFGSEFSRGESLGRVLCFRYSLSFLVNPVHMVGYYFELVKFYWLVNLLQLSVVVLMILLLVPAIGAMGAALALVANELVGLFLFYGLVMWKALKMPDGRSSN